MESKAGRVLAERLAGVVLGADPGAPARMLAQLARLSGRDWLRLDQAARQQFRRSPLDEVADWPARLEARSEIAAVAGSMCRDGHVREAAVAMLSRMPGPVAAAALAVRTADWVPQVRSAAAAAARERTALPDIVVIVPSTP